MTLYMQIIFLVILLGVMYTLVSYSQEGDIGTFTNGVPKISDMKRKYTSQADIVERLHSLLIYKESYVRWNRLLIISMLASIVTLYFLKEEVKLSEFLMLTCFIFICIDLPNRWGHAHISKGVIQEATQLYTLFTVNEIQRK